MNEELDKAFNAYLDASNKYSNVATQEIIDKVAARYPTASKVTVIAILDESYTEHNIEVYDDQGERLNTDDDWPWVDDEIDEHWVMVVTEGACMHEETITILI